MNQELIMKKLEAEDHRDIFVCHSVGEQRVDLGEIRMNYARLGDPSRPPLLLIPGQSESWWGYEAALPLLSEHFEVFAVDLRGQGRSTWTPGRYTLNIFGNDLVRFIDLVIGRPTFVSGLSSGGVLATWLAAYAKPDQILAANLEDPPLFASETDPACGPGIGNAMAPVFKAWNKWLGDQWSVGDWAGMMRTFPDELPPELLQGLVGMGNSDDADGAAATTPDPQPPQNMKEYDPEWGRSFVSGTVAAGCDHETMLGNVRVPVHFTHHFRRIDAGTGRLLGAVSDDQVGRARRLIESAGQGFDYESFPQTPHSMHGADPELFVTTLISWSSGLRL